MFVEHTDDEVIQLRSLVVLRINCRSCYLGLSLPIRELTLKWALGIIMPYQII